MSERPVDIITDEEIERVHANANFGDTGKREVVNEAVLKCACGYHSGSTATAIIQEHKLMSLNFKLTVKGRAYLWSVFGER